MKLKTQVDINNGIDESYRVDQDMFLSAEPDTGDTGKHGDVFQSAGLLHSGYKLPVNFIKIHSVTGSVLFAKDTGERKVIFWSYKIFKTFHILGFRLFYKPLNHLPCDLLIG